MYVVALISHFPIYATPNMSTGSKANDTFLTAHLARILPRPL